MQRRLPYTHAASAATRHVIGRSCLRRASPSPSLSHHQCGAHGGHDLTIQVADPSQLIARDCKPTERFATFVVRRLQRLSQIGLKRGRWSRKDVGGDDVKRRPRCGQDEASKHPRRDAAQHAAESALPFPASFLAAAGHARERHQELQRHPHVDLFQRPHHHRIIHQLEGQAPEDAESERPSCEYAHEPILEGAPMVEEEKGHRRRTPRRGPDAMHQGHDLARNCIHDMRSEEHI